MITTAQRQDAIRALVDLHGIRQGWADLIEAVRRVEPKPEPEEVPDRVKATRDWGVGHE